MIQLFEIDLGGKVVSSWDHANKLNTFWHSVKLSQC